MGQQSNKIIRVNSSRAYQTASKLLVVAFMCLMTTACVSTVVGAVVGTAVAVVKVPFKVAGAVIDAATPDDKKNDLIESLNDNQKDSAVDSDAAALDMESEGL